MIINYSQAPSEKQAKQISSFTLNLEICLVNTPATGCGALAHLSLNSDLG